VALAATYAIVVLCVGLLAGWAGVWSVGHPAMFAIGAYFAAYGSSHGWPLEATVLLAMVAAGLAGGFLGFAGARFSILYIALLTMAFSLVTLEIINRWSSVTGGDQGVPVTELESILGLGALTSGGNAAVYAAVLLAGVVVAFAVVARNTSLRMRMVAAKSHPLAARSVGIAPEAQTALAFAVSAAITGLAGVLLGLITGFVSPDTFSLVLGVNSIAAAVLGGVGAIAGGVVGGVFMAWSPTLADRLSVPQPILQGSLLILALIFLPGGVVPAAGKIARRLGRRLRRSGTPAGAAAEPSVDQPTDVGSGSNRRRSIGEAGQTLLDVGDLSVTFGGLKALDGVSLSVRQGEILAIIGPNGAGKTTFVNVLSGLLSVGRVEGSVVYDGEQLLRAKATARRSLGIGRTFQHAEPFSELTMLENLLCTHRRLSQQTLAQAQELLDRVGLAEVASRLPRELPFGLQKRLDLARASTEAPALLILDEPFGGLDASERDVLARQITRLRDEGVAIVIIDHVIEDLFAVADRVVAFDFGKPIGEGTPDAVLQDEAVRTSYLGTAHVRVPPAPVDVAGEPLVRLHDVRHRYGGVAALRGVDLEVSRGSVLAVVGANGAGKSTLGKVLHGSLHASTGDREVATIDGRRPVRSSLVPEGRALFKTLSVRENLEVAAYAKGVKGARLRERLDETAEWLPRRVRDRMSVPAAALSGGEQQILAIARALMAQPDLLILDEPALGLAPALVDEVYGRIESLVQGGMTVVLLEQLLARALTASHELVVLHEGTIKARGVPADPSFAHRAEQAYFGGDAALLTVEAA
jgi:ABC-type branched-subunit amino acid transport system ATPase component/ABC-type branched-subunit amino acid transport system permease subunit